MGFLFIPLSLQATCKKLSIRIKMKYYAMNNTVPADFSQSCMSKEWTKCEQSEKKKN